MQYRTVRDNHSDSHFFVIITRDGKEYARLFSIHQSQKDINVQIQYGGYGKGKAFKLYDERKINLDVTSVFKI